MVCGCWDTGPGYPRPAALLAGLRALPLDVVECRLPTPFAGAAKRRALSSWGAMARAVPRVLASGSGTRRQVRAALAAHRPDVVLIPYPGHLVAPWLRRCFDGPIVLDLFLSAYDTVVGDRQLLGAGRAAGAVFSALDRRACRAADVVLLDTPEHAQAVAEIVGVGGERFSWVPVSDPWAPAEAPRFEPPRAGAPLRALFFGTGVPLHGLRHLLDAAVGASGVELTLIGGGEEDRRRAAAHGGVRLGPVFVDRPDLDSAIAAAHLVCGVFGASAKASRVVPFKVMHALAAGRPVLTVDAPPVRRAAAAAALLVPPGDPAAIGRALGAARDDAEGLAARAAAARPAYDRRFSSGAVAASLRLALAQAGIETASLPGPSAAGPRPRGESVIASGAASR